MATAKKVCAPDQHAPPRKWSAEGVYYSLKGRFGQCANRGCGAGGLKLSNSEHGMNRGDILWYVDGNFNGATRASQAKGKQ